MTNLEQTLKEHLDNAKYDVLELCKVKYCAYVVKEQDGEDARDVYLQWRHYQSLLANLTELIEAFEQIPTRE